MLKTDGKSVTIQYHMTPEEKEYLKNYNISDFERPSIATDVVVFSVTKEDVKDTRQLPIGKLQVLLINRAAYPYKDYWALPGGFCQKDEEVYETARRELYEETNIKDAYLNLSGIYGDVGRDPRGWIISHAFLALVDGSKCSLRADTDAWEAKWFDIDVRKEIVEKTCCKDTVEIKCIYYLKLECGHIVLSAEVEEHRKYENYHEKVTDTILKSEGIAFDHAKIIINAFRDLQAHAEHDEKIVFDLMPEQFTLTELQKIFEVILQKELLKANFRRKIADYVIETEDVETGRRYRTAKQFRRNVKKFYEI